MTFRPHIEIGGAGQKVWSLVVAMRQTTVDQVSHFDRNDFVAMTFLFLLASLLFFSIKPVGEFPLNDDWAYILPVKWWVERGVLAFTDWQFMTLIGQVLLGIAISSFTEFSITNLRVFVLGLAIVSVLAVYSLSKLLGCSRMFATLAALVLLCNPIFLMTSASFMTDVPFLAACLLALVLHFLGLQKNSYLYVFSSWCFVLLACLIRQNGVAVALGFSLLGLSRSQFHVDKILIATLPMLLVLGILISYPFVVSNTIGLPTMYRLPVNEVTNFIKGIFSLKLGYLLLAGKNFLVALGYLGLCFIPLFAVVNLNKSMPGKYAFTQRFVTPLICLGLTFLLYYFGRITPVEANTFFDFGLGVRNLETIDPPVKAHWLFWFGLAFFGIFMCVSVMATAYSNFSNFSLSTAKPLRSGYASMIFLIVLVYNLPFLTFGGIWFDRYTLFNLALFAPLFCLLASKHELNKLRRKATYITLTLFAAFGAVGTHDYLEWNRQRWHGLSMLQNTYGIAATEIDGGFEFNNYVARLKGDFRRPIAEVNVTRKAAPYRVALSELPSHEVLNVLPCNTFLYGSPRKVFLLRKVP
jgi:4-amino-4-deoxy-L-arabinose transferase-like glycosyltransferase